MITTNYVSSLRIPDERIAMWVLDNALKHSTVYKDTDELYDKLFTELPYEYVYSYTRNHRHVKGMLTDVLNVCAMLPATTHFISVTLSQSRGRDYVINLEVRH